jgi:type IV pilus assembly protein PilA
MRNNLKKGFTLIEVLVVIGIIAILASIVVVAINPARQFAQANNAQRWSNVNAVLNAVHQYSVDNRGSIPSGITNGSSTQICKSGIASTTCTSVGLVYLDMLVPTYVVAMPTDPQGVSTNGTGYHIATTTGNRIVVTAPSAENNETISVTR